MRRTDAGMIAAGAASLAGGTVLGLLIDEPHDPSWWAGWLTAIGTCVVVSALNKLVDARRRARARPADRKPIDIEQMAGEVAKGVMNMQRLTESVREVVAGYRLDLERHGFPSVVADQMAAQYHAFLMTIMVGRSRG